VKGVELGTTPSESLVSVFVFLEDDVHFGNWFLVKWRGGIWTLRTRDKKYGYESYTSQSLSLNKNK
jgi:hypothetical protein